MSGVLFEIFVLRTSKISGWSQIPSLESTGLVNSRMAHVERDPDRTFKNARFSSDSRPEGVASDGSSLV